MNHQFRIHISWKNSRISLWKVSKFLSSWVQNPAKSSVVLSLMKLKHLRLNQKKNNVIGMWVVYVLCGFVCRFLILWDYHYWWFTWNLLHICICWMFFWMYNCMLVRMCHSCRKTHQRNQVSIEMICHVNVSASLASLTTKPFGVTSPKVTDCFIQWNYSHSEQTDGYGIIPPVK